MQPKFLFLNGNLSELQDVAAETARFCRDHHLDGEVEFHLTLALEELFTNAVRYGGCAGVARSVKFELRKEPGAVLVDFADCGRPFDPTTAPSPDLNAPLESRQAGGLGIHLVRQIMRDLRYERSDGWNRVTMRRPLHEDTPCK